MTGPSRENLCSQMTELHWPRTSNQVRDRSERILVASKRGNLLARENLNGLARRSQHGRERIEPRPTAFGGHRVASEGYHGNAEITVNFVDADVDVAFTIIHELFTGAAQNDIMFNDVPLTPDGFASGARLDNQIAATFYGADHAEGGGTFEHDDVLGAFSAKTDE